MATPTQRTLWSGLTILLVLYAPAVLAAPNLQTAVLPTSRAVQVGTPATFFATIINDGDELANQCRIELPGFAANEFSYQRTNWFSNALVGEPNTPIDIPAGYRATFALLVNPTAPVSTQDFEPSFYCENAQPAATLPQINTFRFTASATPVTDIIAFTATDSADGRVELLAEQAAEAFVVAVANLGAPSAVELSATVSETNLPLVLSWCATDPQTSECLAPPTANRPVETELTEGGAATFAVFAVSSGSISFKPAQHRILVNVTAGGNLLSQVSVAPFTRSIPQRPDLNFGLRGEVDQLGLDPSRGDNGRDLVVQSDGKIVVAGFNWPEPGELLGERLLVRYNADGSRDPTFSFRRRERGHFWHQLKLLDDGSFLVGSNDGNRDAFVAKHNPDGSLDESFGDQGVTAQSAQLIGLRSFALDSTGGILAVGGGGGNAFRQGEEDWQLWRYDSTGVLDEEFGNASLGLGPEYFNLFFAGIGVLSNGKIVVSGGVTFYPDRQNEPNNRTEVLFIAQFDADGTLDLDYGDEGVAFGIGGSSYIQTTLIVEPDDSVIVLGARGGRLVRLTKQGAIDTSFGELGVALPACSFDINGTNLSPYRVQRTSNGKLLVIGLANTRDSQFASTGLERYNADGSVDTTFGISGCLTYSHKPQAREWEWPSSVAEGSDGSLFVLSNQGSGEFDPRDQMLLLKLLDDG